MNNRNQPLLGRQSVRSAVAGVALAGGVVGLFGAGEIAVAELANDDCPATQQSDSETSRCEKLTDLKWDGITHLIEGGVIGGAATTAMVLGKKRNTPARTRQNLMSRILHR